MSLTASLSLYFTCLFVVAWSHDLLYFDEFEFEFDLNAATDWDHYHLRQHSSGEHESDAYIDALYKNEKTLHRNLGLLRSLNTPQDYASTCTKKIPLLFRQLCVHWRYDQGFKYHLQSADPSRESQQQSAHVGNNDNNNNNNMLDESTIYVGDDHNWNEVNYANTLSAFTLNKAENDGREYMENYASGSFKSCRYRTRMRECVAFHLPTKKLKVMLKVGRARKEKSTESRPMSMPSNALSLGVKTDKISSAISAAAATIQNEYDSEEEGAKEHEEEEDDDVMSAYDFHQDFEYGDNMGYAEWAANAMQWQTFDCLNCDGRRRQLSEVEEETEAGMFDAYGDYTYMYNEYELHFDDVYDWDEISSDSLLKCTTVIPGLEHKLCVDTANKAHKGAKITFAAAQEQSDIDDGYYDMYGYDTYYYNLAAARQDYADVDWYGDDSDREQDTKTHRQSSNNDDDDNDKGDDDDDGDEGTNYEDYYHTHTDQHNHDAEDATGQGNDNGDGDTDSDLSDEKQAFEAGFDGHPMRTHHRYDADPMAKYPDSYNKIKALEDKQEEEQEDEQEQEQLGDGNGNGNGMNPRMMMNPMMSNMLGGYGYGPRRMLGHRLTAGMPDRKHLIRRLLIDDEEEYGYYYDEEDDEDDDDDDAEFDHLFGDDEFDEYYSETQAIYDEMHATFSNLLRNELSAQELYFLDDDAWDDITTVFDADHRRHSIRKCVALQSSHLCATHSLAEPDKAPVFHLKIGRHKFHRSTAAEAAHAAAADDEQELMDEDAYDDAADDVSRAYQHWYVDDDAFAIDDAQWHDDALWTNSKFVTNALQQQIRRKCQSNEFCLCEYLDTLFDRHRKHVCYYHGHEASHTASHNERVMHAMDDFFTRHLRKFTPMQHASPLRITYHHVPHYHNIPTIHHYHIIGGYPSFHRSTHRHPRLMIPWNAFRQHAHEIPDRRPEWMPPWMYREILMHSGKHESHPHRQQQKTIAKLEKDEKQIVKEIEKKNDAKSGEGKPKFKFNVDARVEKLLGELGGTESSKTKKKSSAHAMDSNSANVNENAEEEEEEDYAAETEDTMRFLFPIMEQNMIHVTAVFDGIHDMVGHGSTVDMQQAPDRVSSSDNAMTETYNMYDDDDDDAYADSDAYEVLDTFEVEGAEWIMERNDAFPQHLLSEIPFSDIGTRVVGSSGLPIQKRCTVLFGTKVCLCQFLHLLKVRETEHLCYPHAPKPPGPPLDVFRHHHDQLKTPPPSNVFPPSKKHHHDELMAADPQKKAWMISQANKINHLVRNELPHSRPLWVPHMFWHWLHHAPHFHLYRHKHRMSHEHLWVPDTISAHRMAADEYEYEYDAFNAYENDDDDDDVYDDFDAFVAYDYDYDQYDDDGDDAYEIMNALDGGAYQGETWREEKRVSERMWTIQVTFVCILIAALFCIIVSCFIWRSKWGRLVRQLLNNRMQRHQRLHEMKMRARIDILSNEDGSSSISSIH